MLLFKITRGYACHPAIGHVLPALWVFGQIPCVKWYDGLLVNGVSQHWLFPTRSGRGFLIRPHFYTAG